jgi:peptide/nickel transport system permease protein
MGIAIWPLEARIIYGQVRSIREREYIQAAKVAGLSSRHIILREILPNALPPVIVQVTLDAGLAVLVMAGLGFLGMNDPLYANWGQLLNSAQDYMFRAWWMSVFPGVAIAIAVLGFAFLGDGFNDIMNPQRTSGRRGI